MRALRHTVRGSRLCGAEGANNYDDRAKDMLPASATHKWETFEGSLQRWAFAWTLGIAAVVMSAILWILSVPWVAWCLLRCVRPVVSAPEFDTKCAFSV